MGRPFESVANADRADHFRSELLRALLRYARTPIDLVAPAPESSSAQAFEETVAALGLDRAALDVRVVSHAVMASELAAGRYALIHDPVGYGPGLGFHLRDRFARNPVACTAVHPGRSFASRWMTDFFPAVLPGSRPYDAIFCPGDSAEQFTRRVHAALADGLSGTLGDSAGYKGRYVQIPLGVDPERFRPRDRSEARAQLGLPQSALILFWNGPFSAGNKADLTPLLRTTAEIRRQRPDLDLFAILAGSSDEEYVRHLRSVIARFALSDTVELRTEVPAFAAPLLYNAADIFIGFSDNLGESFDLSVVEAMASGLPVVAADWAGGNEIVVHDETGLIVPALWDHCDGGLSATALLYDEREIHLQEAQSVAIDLPALIASLTTLLLDPALRRDMGERGRERAVREYAWEHVIRRYEEIWDELSAQARSDARPPFGSTAFPLFRPSQIFRAHPTEFVTTNTLVRLSQLGADCIRGKASVAPDAAAAPYLDTALLERMLKNTGRRAALRPAPVGKILEGIVGPGEIEQAEGLRHLMWLLKYDLLEVP